jgi:hypothetical protein
VGAPRRLAVDGDELVPVWPQRRHPAVPRQPRRRMRSTTGCCSTAAQMGRLQARPERAATGCPPRAATAWADSRFRFG